MKKMKILAALLSASMVVTSAAIPVFADETAPDAPIEAADDGIELAAGLPEADANGVVALTEDVTLTGDNTVSSITTDGHKIYLASNATLTVDGTEPTLYDNIIPGTPDNVSRYCISYTKENGKVKYIHSDIYDYDSAGYGMYMQGYPTVIEALAEEEGAIHDTDIKITYTKDGTDYVILYKKDDGTGDGMGAVIYGGTWTRNATLNTSITMKSGKVAALVAGSKTSTDVGYITKAVINIEGGEICGDDDCTSQPYEDQGMVMGIWYQGPNIGEFELNMTGGKIDGVVYGGGATSTSPASKAFKVDKFTANISGGEIGTLYGGGHSENKNTQTVGDVNINISGNAKIDEVFGGGFALWTTDTGSKAIVNNADINIDGDATVGTVFAGGQNGTGAYYNTIAEASVGTASITVNSPKVGIVYGGGKNFHWNNFYDVVEDPENPREYKVVKKNWNDTAEIEMVHYSNVNDVTLNVNQPVTELYLGGSSWAHIGKSTANINADLPYVSCIGKYGWVEDANVVVSENATVEHLDMVRSGIVGDVEIDNYGVINTLVAGAPEGNYKNNMGTSKVAIMGDVLINNYNEVDAAPLTYGLEFAKSVTSNVFLTPTKTTYGEGKGGASSGHVEKKNNSIWKIMLSGKQEFTDADEDVAKKITFEQIGETNKIQVYINGEKDGVAADIRNLVAVDLTFKLTGDFAITDFALADDNWTYDVYDGNRYLIHEKGQEDGANDINGARILLGTLTLGGYGSGSINAEFESENTVEQRKADNIVVSGEVTAEKLTLKDIKIEEKPVTINVMFPNMLDETNMDKDYINMKVKVKGGVEIREGGTLAPIDKEISLKTGTIIKAADPSGFTAPEGETYPAANGYKITLPLPTGYRYTFTFEGEGYRTYTVDAIVKDDMTLTVWNNVMEDEHVVVVSDGTEKKEIKTFLAGDIVMDNKINLYDLSAVVAYFGKGSLISDSEYEKYIQYDLNRDGSIDSKDIAMVLVSWNK